MNTPAGRFCPLSEAEQDALPEPKWLVADRIPAEGTIVVCGTPAIEYGRSLEYLFRLHGMPARAFDARDLPPLTFAPKVPSGVSIVMLLPDTNTATMRRLCDGAACIIRAIDGVTGSIEKLLDGPEADGEKVDLRKLARRLV